MVSPPPNNENQEAIDNPRPRPVQQNPQKKEIWKDYIAPVFCCFSKKDGYEEIGGETAGELSQRIQDLYNLFDRLNEQLQSVQSSNEMQRILQERLVEQVHDMDDLISNNKSELITELQDLGDREAFNRDDLRETLLRYLEEERLKDIEDVLTGHSHNSTQMVEQILSVKHQVASQQEALDSVTPSVIELSELCQKLDARLQACEAKAGISDEEKSILLEEFKQKSSYLVEKENETVRRLQTLEQTNELLLARMENGADGQKQVDAAFITRLTDMDKEQDHINSKIDVIEKKIENLASRGYIDTLIKSLEDDRNQFIAKSVERTAAFHMEQNKKELAQKQASRIGEIEGKLEGLRVLVTGLVKSVETRDAELTHMNKSYFDELQKHVDDTSEELRRTFAEFKVIKKNFEEQHRRMSSIERCIDRVGDVPSIEDDIHILAKKLERLENRVEHVVDKVVELGDRSPSPELDDLARLKRDLRKGTKPLNVTTANKRDDMVSAAPATSAEPAGNPRRVRQLSGLGEKSAFNRRVA